MILGATVGGFGHHIVDLKMDTINIFSKVATLVSMFMATLTCGSDLICNAIYVSAICDPG